MGSIQDRRSKADEPIFRPAGTFFRFKNGWTVSIEDSNPNSIDHFDVKISTATYHAVTFAPNNDTALRKIDADRLVDILATVRSFTPEVEAATAAKQIAKLTA
jgi:hypothetical protein